MCARVVSGSAHRVLAGAGAAALGKGPVACELERFPDGELWPVVGSVRGGDVYGVQPHRAWIPASGGAGAGQAAISRYARVVAKVSGEALAVAGGWGTDPASLAHLADEVLSVHDLGVQVAVVLGGGNYFRGRMAEAWGIGRAEADNIGMLGTVMNALMLRGALVTRGGSDVRIMTATPMQSVAEPFIRLRALRHLRRGLIMLLAGGIGQPYVTTDHAAVQRALELDADALLVAKHGVDGVYDHDPRTQPGAKRYTSLSHGQALAPEVRVMDVAALVLAAEHDLTMHIFDAAATGAMSAICQGQDIGTRVADHLTHPEARVRR